MKTLALGIMSGTSLDGVDLALCEFENINNSWNFQIIEAKTFDYPDEWDFRLRSAHLLNAYEFVLLHNEYGRFLGNIAQQFLFRKPKTDLIASHGHTVFHQPDKKLTFQLGNGASIAATTGITTVGDFRNLDVALGGQGAPLVPIGDKLLFAEWDYCLNIGGFANISFETENKRMAFDICPANIILNELASKKGFSFDKDGEIGRSGKPNSTLLGKLNALYYYHQTWPKSLGREWCEESIAPLFSMSSQSVENQMATFYEHVAQQIGKIISKESSKTLVTGGGAKNRFLIERIKYFSASEIVVPNEKIINFKEALIFAFLGVLRIYQQENCFSSVTGASTNNIGGAVFQMKS